MENNDEHRPARTDGSNAPDKEAIARVFQDLRMVCGVRCSEWMRTSEDFDRINNLIIANDDLHTSLATPMHPRRVRSVEEETDRLVARMVDIYARMDRAELTGVQLSALRGALPARADMPIDQAGLLAFARNLLERLGQAEGLATARIVANDLYLVRMAIKRLESAMARPPKRAGYGPWERALTRCLLATTRLDELVSRLPPEMPFVKAYNEARINVAAFTGK